MHSRAFEGGTHQASSDSRAALCFSSGMWAQNCCASRSTWDGIVDAGARHFFFVDAEDFSQAVQLGAHFLKHLPHGVDLRIAPLVAFQSEAHGNVLGELQQRRFVRGFRWGLARRARTTPG